MIRNLPQSLIHTASNLLETTSIPLNEALASPAHKAMITKAVATTTKDGMTAAERISKDVMPSDRVVIPIQRDADPDKDVVNHLAMHGYKVDDYKSGLAYHKTTPTRKMKIGKVLGATNASQEIKQKYEKDPARQGLKSDVYAVISRKPHDVAAMSTHQNWESCQTLGGKAKIGDTTVEQQQGSQRQMVPGIVASGAHIAYLVKHPDDIDKHYKPIARVTLNPYVGTDDTGAKHTILRPSKVYGEEWSGFHKTVSDWAEKNFPAKGPVYFRHSDAYPEGEESISNYSPKFNEFWKKQHDPVTLSTHPEQDVLSHHVQKAISENNSGAATHLVSNPHLNDNDAERLVSVFTKNKGSRDINEFAQHASSSRQVGIVMNNSLGNFHAAKHLARNKNANAEQLHELFDNYGLGQTSTPGERVDVHNGYSPSIVHAVMHHPNADDSHFAKMFEHKSFSDKHAPTDGGHNAPAWDSYLDHTDSLKAIARRYTSEDIGRKLISLQTKLPAHDHDIIYDVAEKHPHLLRDIPDASIAYAYGRHPMSNNLKNVAIGRGSDETLSALARHSDDAELLDKLASHPNPQVSGHAKIRKQLIDLAK